MDGFIRPLSWRERGHVPWFAVTERGPGNVMHIHAVLAAKVVSIEDVRACWKLGISSRVGAENCVIAWDMMDTLSQNVPAGTCFQLLSIAKVRRPLACPR